MGSSGQPPAFSSCSRRMATRLAIFRGHAAARSRFKTACGLPAGIIQPVLRVSSPASTSPVIFGFKTLPDGRSPAETACDRLPIPSRNKIEPATSAAQPTPCRGGPPTLCRTPIVSRTRAPFQALVRWRRFRQSKLPALILLVWAVVGTSTARRVYPDRSRGHSSMPISPSAG